MQPVPNSPDSLTFADVTELAREDMQAVDRLMLPRVSVATVEVSAECLHEDVIHERAFSGTGNSRDTDKGAKGDVNVNLLQIVVLGPQY